jgi:fatty-acyl-CoA synthase
MNIGTLLTKVARTFPDKLAIFCGPKKLTYAQFNARANRMANALNHLGVRQGDKVALLQHNYPQMLESMFACFKAGMVRSPLTGGFIPKSFLLLSTTPRHRR